MRVAIIVNNTVHNIVEASSVAVAKAAYPGSTAFEAAGVDIGWTKQGSNWAPPQVPSQPRSLTHLEFIDHVQEHGDVSDAGLVSAKADPLLAAFWIKFDIATAFERDNATTQQGLAALVATGHLTEPARQTIIDEWPSA